MGEHSGRVALVSGAGSGIGQATAVALSAAGATVIVQDRDAAAVEATLGRISGQGGKAIALVCDVRDEAAVLAGTGSHPHIGLLMHCAGIADGGKEIARVDRAAFDEMISIHVWGAFNLVRAVEAGMRAHSFGRMVITSSNRGQVGFERSSHYSTAKAALLGATKAWAREFAPHNILVNAIAPGVVRTGMTLSHGMEALREEADLNLIKRWAEPEEIAATALFLFGATGSYFTGQVLSPNGGDPIVGI